MLNRSERMVYRLCRQSFLSLWSYPNPLNNEKKELCDVLVIFGPDVIIFSVKDVGLPDINISSVDRSRWSRRAVEASANQIYGAERAIGRLDHVIRNDGLRGLPLPPIEDLRVHRIAVALGSRGEVPIPSGGFGKGLVHVLDEDSLNVLLAELDTIADFTGYLLKKEELHGRVSQLVIEGGEKELLAVYLFNNREFPNDADTIVVQQGHWDNLIMRPEYRAKKREDQVSYFWDSLIETLSESVGFDEFGPPQELEEVERVVRTMASENRFSRRILAGSFREWHVGAISRSRLQGAPSGVVYVFLARPQDFPREERRTELQARCFIARGLHPDSSAIIGLATEEYGSKGFSFDAVYLHMPEWTQESQKRLEELQERTGWFTEVGITRRSEDEYPTPERDELKGSS